MIRAPRPDLGIDDQSGPTHHPGHCRHGGGATVSEAGTAGQDQGTAGQDQWKPEELELRRDEVKNARRSARVQSFLGLCAAAATVIAAIGALYAAKAVNTASEGIQRQANADRLSAALSAIGGEQAAERVAGFGLLRRHVQYRLTTSDTPEDRLDAYDLYTNALDVLENYLRNPADEATTQPTKVTAQPAGLGFGRPLIPYDNKYAARELQNLLRLKPQIQKLYNSFEVKPPAPQPLADAKDTISSTLLQQQQNQALKAWVKDAQSTYEVTYAPGYAPASTGTTDSGTSTG